MQEFAQLKKSLHEKVKLRMDGGVGVRDDSVSDAHSMSRRSSKLHTMKRNNYSEDSENFNLYLLLELIKLEQNPSNSTPKQITPKVGRKTSKRQKISESKEKNDHCFYRTEGRSK